MVKNIAAQADVEVPDFLEYIYKYSLPMGFLFLFSYGFCFLTIEDLPITNNI